MQTSTRVWALVALGLVGTALLAGCRDPARITTRRLERLEAIASRDLNCPGVALELTEVIEHVVRAVGCGQWADYSIHRRGRHRRSGARWTRVISISERAEAELACPAVGMRIDGLTPTSMAATGCGRSATFELRCNERSCGWVVVSGVTGGAPSATPARGETTGVIVVVPAIE